MDRKNSMVISKGKAFPLQPYGVQRVLGGFLEAIPLQALTGPEGFRRLRFPDFKTIGT
jgi:hypothetical protein